MQCKFGTIEGKAGHPPRRVTRPALERLVWPMCPSVVLVEASRGRARGQDPDGTGGYPDRRDQRKHENSRCGYWAESA
jgi:hypothetical protein